MADTSTRITNLSEGGSPERVAFDMFKYLRNLAPDANEKSARKDALLDLYAECLYATKGHRNPHRKYGDEA